MESRQRRKRRWQWLQARARVIRMVFSRLGVPLILFVLILLFGTAIFWLSGAERNLARAHLYVLNLVTFQSSPDDMPNRPWLQVAAYTVMTGGVLCLAGGAARVFQLLHDPQEQQFAMASILRDHIIVCGVGKVGFGVIQQLLEFDESIVAVNAAEQVEWADALKKAGVPLLIADARRRETLVDAGIEHASSIVVCTSDDLTNLDIALDAREINPNVRVIMRMFDASLAQKVSRGFGIHCALSVPALAAPAFAVAATRAAVDHAFTLNGQFVSISTVTFQQGSRFIGRSIADVEREVNCSFVGRVTEAGLAFHLDHQAAITAGDCFSVMGALEALRKLEK